MRLARGGGTVRPGRAPPPLSPERGTASYPPGAGRRAPRAPRHCGYLSICQEAAPTGDPRPLHQPLRRDSRGCGAGWGSGRAPVAMETWGRGGARGERSVGPVPGTRAAGCGSPAPDAHTGRGGRSLGTLPRPLPRSRGLLP